MRHGHEDPIIKEVLGNYHRAGLTLISGFALLLVWLGTWLAGAIWPSSVAHGGVLPSVSALTGCGGLSLVLLSAAHYAYAHLFVHAIARRER
jgi:hypothetical protein